MHVREKIAHSKNCTILFYGYDLDIYEQMFISIYLIWISATDRQKAMHKSPPCNLHRWAQKSAKNSVLHKNVEIWMRVKTQNRTTILNGLS